MTIPEFGLLLDRALIRDLSRDLFTIIDLLTALQGDALSEAVEQVIFDSFIFFTRFFIFFIRNSEGE
jgi:hypothetical protein